MSLFDWRSMWRLEASTFHSLDGAKASVNGPIKVLDVVLSSIRKLKATRYVPQLFSVCLRLVFRANFRQSWIQFATCSDEARQWAGEFTIRTVIEFSRLFMKCRSGVGVNLWGDEKNDVGFDSHQTLWALECLQKYFRPLMFIDLLNILRAFELWSFFFWFSLWCLKLWSSQNW